MGIDVIMKFQKRPARIVREPHLGITIYAIYAVVRMGVGLITSASTRIDIPHHGTLAGGDWCQSLLQLLLLLPILRSSVLEPNLRRKKMAQKHAILRKCTNICLLLSRVKVAYFFHF